jgi:co-chaperonin GroES (HSP10)
MKAQASRLRPIQAHILVRDMNFGEQKSAGGIVLKSDDGKSEGVRPRWCKIFAVGPQQQDVKAGEWILVEHGRWTRGLEVEEDDGTKFTIWRVDPTGILMSADEKPAGIEFGAWTTASHGSVHNPEDFVHMR